MIPVTSPSRQSHKTPTLQQRLTVRAVFLRKAGIMVAELAGLNPHGRMVVVEDYGNWDKDRLKSEVRALEAKLVADAGTLLAEPKRVLSVPALGWFYVQFVRWEQTRFRFLHLGTVQAFEKGVGILFARRSMDIPPYAELLLQPRMGVAFRHPECMLAYDVRHLRHLYGQALTASVPGLRAFRYGDDALGSAEAQGLARTTILTCFNLLESFVSGLARAHVMTHPDLAEDAQTKLLSTRGALSKRVVAVPRFLLGREPRFNAQHPLFKHVFDDLKPFRDAFVHCEPGADVSAHGYVKEQYFHAVPPELVDDVVQSVHDAIHVIWQDLHGADGPHWVNELMRPTFAPTDDASRPAASDLRSEAGCKIPHIILRGDLLGPAGRSS